jgi:hypothetical protein
MAGTWGATIQSVSSPPRRLGIVVALDLTGAAPQHRAVDRRHVDVIARHLDLEDQLAGVP